MFIILISQQQTLTENIKYMVINDIIQFLKYFLYYCYLKVMNDIIVTIILLVNYTNCMYYIYILVEIVPNYYIIFQIL